MIMRLILCLLSLHFYVYSYASADTIRTDIPCDTLLYYKMTQNRGEGDVSLQGVRNLRPVLNGVLYRSGANNKTAPFLNRTNDNPLAFQTLLNLRENGFGKAYYLYAKNFQVQYTPDMLSLLSQVGIDYKSVVPTNDSLVLILLSEIQQTIEYPDRGAILIHCWNGWHMSGLVSAYALMQFCDFTPTMAWDYWRKGTDGNDRGFTKLRKRIFAFQPNKQLKIGDYEKSTICPCTNLAKH